MTMSTMQDAVEGAGQTKACNAEQVQANLIRAAKRVADNRPRDWLLFFFFRILDDVEVDATLKRIEGAADEEMRKFLWLDFAHPT